MAVAIASRFILRPKQGAFAGSGASWLIVFPTTDSFGIVVILAASGQRPFQAP
jgi:hypothetical protein